MPSEQLAEQHVREFTRASVRAGLLTADELHREVVEAIIVDLPSRAADAATLAAAWIDDAREELRVDQQGWPDATDYERLQTAFDELALDDIVVLQGCDDHWAAKAVLDERARPATRRAASRGSPRRTSGTPSTRACSR